jgi:hypothetical protein
MAQLSRPYQIGLAAVAVLAAAWLILLGGHHSSTSGGGSSSAPASQARTVHAPNAPAAAKAHPQGNAGSATGGGSASSLGGLGHAIEKAHGAVGASQKNAKELASKSAQASTPNSTSSKAAGAGAAAHAKSTPSAATSAPSATHAAPKSAPSTHGTVRATVAVRQHAVERQLKQGKIALIFFWNPKGADDRAVNRSLGQLPHNLRIAINRARANAVTTFGTITRGVQVYGTPTLLVVNKKGEVTTMTGLQDPYTIAQAIREARR